MNTAGILLAAGASTRLGFPKQLLKIEGITLIRRATETLIATGCQPIIVVLGAHADRILPELTALPVTVVHNPGWQTGMASSIRAGLTAAMQLDTRLDAVLITLSDQPRVTTNDLNALIELVGTATKPIAAAAYKEAVGVPAVFDAALFPELLALDGESGARKVISAHRHEIARMPLPAAAVDVDTKDDLASVGIIPDVGPDVCE